MNRISHLSGTGTTRRSAIWGKRWGAQGIGRLRKIAVVRPTEVEALPWYDQDQVLFLMHTEKPSLEIMQEQHDGLVEIYKKEGIKVHYMDFPSQPRGPYGPLKRSISAAAGFVINGGHHTDFETIRVSGDTGQP